MIGSAAEASEILAHVHDKWRIREENMMYNHGHAIGPVRQIPELSHGWKRIGGGCYRHAWLSPSNVVYKVEREYGAGFGQSNHGEYENILRILRSGKSIPGVSIPRTTLYTLDGRAVMAMEYVKGETASCYHDADGCSQLVAGQCLEHSILEVERVFGLRDMHSANAVFVPEQKRMFVIDIGA